jgi:hypothetical protein
VKATLRLTGLVLAGLFLAFHLPFLPASLEDLDSINFALGVRDFDVSRHQPHPPGYPIFIALAKALRAVGLSEVHSLSLIGIFAGAAAILALIALFDAIDEDQDPALVCMAAGLVAISPLYWLTAARPLSDATGLAAALGVQALLVRARGTRSLTLAAGVAALAVGLRSQVLWLTCPLLLVVASRLRRDIRWRGALSAAIAYVAGLLMWGVPLVVASGGPVAYWNLVFSQGAEDLSGVTMLATTPSLRQLFKALQYTFVMPWAYWQLAAAMLMLASVGLLQMIRRAPSALVFLAAGFGPYLVFDVLFQETVTTRYALPLVVPVVYLAFRGLVLVPQTPGRLLAFSLIGCSAVVDDGLLFAYARSEAPVFRMLGDMTEARSLETSRVPALAMHRREDFDLRRPLEWLKGTLPPFRLRLPSTAKHEWLEVVKYWNRGGTDPIWFVADPLRSDLALLGRPQRPVSYRWALAQRGLLGGVRPDELDWHRLDSPDWYLGEGWSLTPETAGLAREDDRGPAAGGAAGWIRRWLQPVTVMVGGRNLAEGGEPARVRVTLDGAALDEFQVVPGFFLKMLDVPMVGGPGAYAPIVITSDRPQLAVEQFDAQPEGRVLFGFGDGWHEQEYDPSTGELWRWTSNRAVLRVRAGGHAVALTLRGEVEAARRSRVVIRAGDRTIAEFDAGRSFVRTILIPAEAVAGAEASLVLESSASYVPAESTWRSRDRRRLGLKLFECRVTQAS